MGLKTTEDWKDLYQKLTFWELKLEDSQDPTLTEILEAQKTEANQQFGKFIENNYEKCYGCNKTICNNCYDKEDKCICEHFDNPKPNKWWCRNCYDFNKKMKELK